MAAPINKAMFGRMSSAGGEVWIDPMYLDSHQRNWERRVNPDKTSQDTYQVRSIDIIQCHGTIPSTAVGGEQYRSLIAGTAINLVYTHNTDVRVKKNSSSNPLDTKELGKGHSKIYWPGSWKKQSVRTQTNGIITSVHLVLRKISSGSPDDGDNGGWVED